MYKNKLYIIHLPSLYLQCRLGVSIILTSYLPPWLDPPPSDENLAGILRLRFAAPLSSAYSQTPTLSTRDSSVTRSTLC